jgi:hypothetical protein
MNENEFMNDVDSMFKKKLEQDPEYKILVKDKIENKIFQENDPGFNYSKVLFDRDLNIYKLNTDGTITKVESANFVAQILKK